MKASVYLIFCIFCKIGLLLGFNALAHENFKSSMCREWLQKYHNSLKPIPFFGGGHDYLIHPHGTNEALKLTFVDYETTPDGELIGIFNTRQTFKTLDEPVEIKKFPINKISARSLLSFSDYQEGLFRKIQTFHKNFKEHYVVRWKSIFGNSNVIARGAGIVVTSNKNPSNQTRQFATSVVDQIQKFDSLMRDAGFRIPKHTQIHLGEADKIPMESYTLPSPILNPFRLKFMSHIHLGPFFEIAEGHRAIYDIGIALHERAHSILFSGSYSQAAHVNSNFNFLEAIADYLASDFLDVPFIAPNVVHLGIPIRRLDTRNFIRMFEESDGASLHKIENLTDLTPRPSHHNSLIYSYVLWKLRTERSSLINLKFIKELIEHLNQNESSGFRYYAKKPKVSELNEQLREFDFFIANLLEVMNKHQIPNSEALMAEILSDMKLGIDPALALRPHLKSDKKSWSQKSWDLTSDNLKTYFAVGMPIMAPPLILVSGGVLVYMGMEIFSGDFDDEPEPPSQPTAQRTR